MRKLSLWIIALLLPFTAICRGDADTFYTRDFPQPDRAEVVTAITPTVTDGPKMELDAAQARKLAKLLRTQVWLGSPANCDKSQYILRFYAGKKLIAAGAICFHCGCFAPLGSDLHAKADPVAFDRGSARAKALEAFLAKLLPSPSGE